MASSLFLLWASLLFKRVIKFLCLLWRHHLILSLEALWPSLHRIEDVASHCGSDLLLSLLLEHVLDLVFNDGSKLIDWLLLYLSNTFGPSSFFVWDWDSPWFLTSCFLWEIISHELFVRHIEWFLFNVAVACLSFVLSVSILYRMNLPWNRQLLLGALIIIFWLEWRLECWEYLIYVNLFLFFIFSGCLKLSYFGSLLWFNLYLLFVFCLWCFVNQLFHWWSFHCFLALLSALRSFSDNFFFIYFLLNFFKLLNFLWFSWARLTIIGQLEIWPLRSLTSLSLSNNWKDLEEARETKPSFVFEMIFQVIKFPLIWLIIKVFKGSNHTVEWKTTVTLIFIKDHPDMLGGLDVTLNCLCNMNGLSMFSLCWTSDSFCNILNW